MLNEKDCKPLGLQSFNIHLYVMDTKGCVCIVGIKTVLLSLSVLKELERYLLKQRIGGLIQTGGRLRISVLIVARQQEIVGGGFVIIFFNIFISSDNLVFPFK